ncbi:ParA family protein [Negativicoccus succinicivorans]|uniref:ParA family protein n=1 Tax=Negativicoccus succinicivorans TaxID=620903 RepID=UPI002902F7C0|nr:ParA family protein [Negativicoccus succinicivorans]MDU1055654.1 ParA family protein [Negativicoccus succinicivorans]MDU2929907.1 ParA family protein [Negativicoccus succinicivorans]
MGKIIAIMNQKGGVGKTTTAVNLAACLAEAGQAVLLVDMDAQGNATSGLGIDKDRIESSGYEVLIEGASAKKACVKTAVEGLSVLPATIALAGAEVELVNMVSRETKLRDALGKLKKKFDYILIDCPPSLGLLTVNALVAAGSVLVPIQCEYYALEGVAQLLQTIRSVSGNWNPSLHLEGVVLTMFDGRTNLSLQVADEVKKHFGEKVYRTLIPRNVRLSEAPSYGEPIILYDGKSKGAEVYRELAQEVLRRG